MIGLNNIVAKAGMTSKRVIFGSMLVVIAFSMGLASQVSAVSTLDTSSALFLGTITPDVPASETSEVSYINFLIDLTPGTGGSFSGQNITRSTNTLCFPACPDATTTGSVRNSTSGDNDGSFGSGFTYLLAKYDAEQGGGLVWYVAGLTGDFVVQANFGSCGASGCGISHWTLYNPGSPPAPPPSVPEPSSLILLGVGLMACRLVLKKLRMRNA